ncbi:DUF4344 domain-containing metallopeptidase [Pseudomonas sp. PSE14]|uniref:DUF4344 domain-containing metallopeptidase n=1 Tax=Pseudomonas sp. PSE14 TaxID=3016341 RepID=UPI0023D88395|nr:DUF4344 domain-containing metallopeptidase [Pseudomonas sp. PSE14]WEJ71172.1 DUF4344 domain-containing metallopeptidase [Pseudomonas sp. PSE14]
MSAHAFTAASPPRSGCSRTHRSYLALLFLLCAGLVCADTAPPLSPNVARFVLANAEFSVMHEMGHMLIAEYDLPVLGREEDAADQLGFILLFRLYAKLPQDEIDARLLDIADYWRLEWQTPKPPPDQVLAWDSHPLDEQRYYNIACLLYGSDMGRLDWVPALTGLPYERAVYCDQEFKQASKAVNWVLHVRRTQAIRHHPGARLEFEPPLINLEETEQLIALLRDENHLQALVNEVFLQFHPPRPLTLRLINCGAPDAWYNINAGEMALCYERLQHFREMAENLPRLRTPVTRQCPGPAGLRPGGC